MASTFDTLTPEHEELVHSYLRFMRAKRDIGLHAMEADFRDTKSDRLYDDMYSQEDVEGIVDSLEGAAVANLRQEVGAMCNMTALLMKQLLERADTQGAVLTFDTGVVEDQALLEEVEKLRVDGYMRQRGGSGNVAAGRLVSIKDEHARINGEKDRLEADNQTLQARFNKLQGECSKILRDKTALQEEVESLSNQLRFRAEEKPAAKSEGAGSREDSCKALALQRELDRLKDRLAEAEEEAERRVDQSKQFQQLKKLLTSKSEQVVQLRRRLARYESDEDGPGDTKYEDE